MREGRSSNAATCWREEAPHQLSIVLLSIQRKLNGENTARTKVWEMQIAVKIRRAPRCLPAFLLGARFGKPSYALTHTYSIRRARTMSCHGVNMSFLPCLAASLARECVVCGDFNPHHGSWGSARTYTRGKNLMSAAGAAGLAVINSG